VKVVFNFLFYWGGPLLSLCWVAERCTSFIAVRALVPSGGGNTFPERGESCCEKLLAWYLKEYAFVALTYNHADEVSHERLRIGC